MRHSRPRTRRARLRGWTKWLPFLIMPFSVLFAEAWLHIETLQNDYRAHEVSKQIGVHQRDIETLEEEQLRLSTMERIGETAPGLGLVKPEPNQIQVLPCVDRGSTLVLLPDAHPQGNRDARTGAPPRADHPRGED